MAKKCLKPNVKYDKSNDTVPERSTTFNREQRNNVIIQEKMQTSCMKSKVMLNIGKFKQNRMKKERTYWDKDRATHEPAKIQNRNMSKHVRMHENIYWQCCTWTNVCMYIFLSDMVQMLCTQCKRCQIFT